MEEEGKALKFPQLHGIWDGAFMATFQDGSEQLLWKKNPPHKHPSRYLRHTKACDTPACVKAVFKM